MKAYLQRLKPGSDGVWYYSIQIQRDLLGDWQVLREWGRSGSPGTLRQVSYETHAEAVEALLSLRRELQRKGYQLVIQEGLNPAMALFMEGGE
ncbi:MAG: WGR domain-containing protein [Magnetococcales bacterium]|nr:WGR domain-containing protein [Magnetococcales bacterium]